MKESKIRTDSDVMYERARNFFNPVRTMGLFVLDEAVDDQIQVLQFCETDLDDLIDEYHEFYNKNWKLAWKKVMQQMINAEHRINLELIKRRKEVALKIVHTIAIDRLDKLDN